ncbi:MAG: hypothetical protein Q7S61_02755 [bacterium]|nr:hypothetical protein [bacterium]
MEYTSATFLGKSDNVYLDSISSSRVYSAVRLPVGLSTGGRLEKLRAVLEKDEIPTLSHFEEQIESFFLSERENINAAVGYLKGRVLYLKTIGNGVIFLKRGSTYAVIISGDTSASGYMQEGDIYGFTTKEFVHSTGEEEIKRCLLERDAEAIVDALHTVKKKDAICDILLCVSFISKVSLPRSLPVVTVSQKKGLKDFFQEHYQKFRTRTDTSGKRYLTFAVVVIILGIFVWSVGLGYQRKKNDDIKKKIDATRISVDKKLAQADEAAFLNMAHAISLLQDAKSEVQKLKSEIPSGSQVEIQKLQEEITAKENLITKKEEKTANEFFDLAVENADAQASKIALHNDTAAILDSKNKIVYFLSLSKKSISKKSLPEVNEDSLLTVYEENAYVLIKGTGIERVNADGVKKVIPSDDSWRNIKDITTYNGNIYLLEGGSVYKYIPTADGYSDKINYFGSSSVFSGSDSLAIDSSVYISFNDHIEKYSAGQKDEFKTDFPLSSIQLGQLFTSKDLEKVYVRDKEKGSLYVLDKSGAYQKEVQISSFDKAADYVVFNDSVYYISGSKVYKATL